MKKSILFIAAGALALSACTSSEVIEEGVQSNAIGFQNYVSKESRTVTTADFKAFHVYGYYTKATETGSTAVVGVFNDDLVTKAEKTETVDDVTTTKTVWGYDNTRYWVPGAKYYFYAYSCDNQEAPTGVASFDLTGSNTDARALGLNNYVLHNHDLVYADNEGIVGVENGNKKVELQFTHILTRVRATFKSAFAPGYQIQVSNVRLVDVCNEGNFTPKPSYAWSSVEKNVASPEVKFNMLVEEGKTYDVAKAAVPAVGTEDEEGYVAAQAAVDARTSANYVIPFEYKESSVKLVFDIDVMDSTGKLVYEQTITGTWKPNWEMSKAYNYNITISGVEAGLEAIEFDVKQTITGWGDATEILPGDPNNENQIEIKFESTAKN